MFQENEMSKIKNRQIIPSKSTGTRSVNINSDRLAFKMLGKRRTKSDGSLPLLPNGSNKKKTVN